ncbi:ABC transporter substrate-binding protein [Georgenia sp. EYE_87]|uniref:peptide ABC transporter substrate-binding protein n=1 Tax=Georgenia sp. EYE_87 TaxID=2853448 RepID=UPI0027E2B6CE|nr:ABC transporter substrate-binding protein [Georgenia sp. EYE_87]
MKTKRMAGMAATILTGSLVLAACGSSGDDTAADETAGATDGATSSGIVTVNGTEPQNPLLPAHTNETGGGRIMTQLFAGLVRYNADGSVENEIAESIETEDNQTFTIKLQDGWTFSDGSPVTASSFVDAWNYGALLSNAQNNSYFFEIIEGFSYDEDSELTGLEVVDDLTFTVKLVQPEADFPLRLGYTAYYPLPEVFFEDPEAFGENPVGNGPYMFDGEGAWEHNVRVDMVPNPEYKGGRAPQNGGVSVVFYEQEDAAYADLLSGNLDVIENIPNSSITSFEDELEGRSVNQPAAINQTLSVPSYLPEWSGEAGLLRRQAISHAINRDEVTEVIFNGTRTPAKDFTSPVIAGWSEEVPGNEVLEFDPERAKELWAEAEAIEPWGDRTFTIATNTDSDHQPWVDAVNNSIRNTLGIEAEMEPYAQFSEFLDARDNKQMTGMFRAGWQGDYPSLANFLAPIYTEGAGSNDAFYASEEFESLMAQGNSAESIEEANEFFLQAQEVLFRDLPGIPLWYQNVTGGWADTVDNVEFGWDSEPLLYQVTKSE